MRERAITSDEQVLAQATKQAVQAAGGLEACARETGKSTSQLSRCCSPNEADSITIRDAAIIEGIGHGGAGHPHILRAQARLLGCVVVPLPECHDSTDGLAQCLMDLTSELGDLAAAIRDAGRDRITTPEEARLIVAELNELDAASARLRLQLNSLIEAGNRPKN